MKRVAWVTIVGGVALASCGGDGTTVSGGVGGASTSHGPSASSGGSASSTTGMGAGGSASSTGGGGSSSTATTGGMGGSGGGVVLPWTKHFGGDLDDFPWGLTVNAKDEITLQALYFHTIDFGGGPLVANGRNIALAHFDASGKPLWSKVFNKTRDAQPDQVLDDGSGNLLLVGGAGGIINEQIDFGGTPLPQGPGGYIVKLDGSGNFVWSNFSPGSGCAFSAVDSTHAIVCVGTNEGTVDLGTGPIPSNGSNDVVVAKLDSSGKAIWAHDYGDANNQGGGYVAVDANDDVLVVGINQGTIDFGGGPLNSISVSSGFVAKLDSDGKHVWSKKLDCNAGQNGVDAFRVASDSAKNAIVTGGFAGDCDFGGGIVSSSGPLETMFIAKYDSSGNHVWSKKFGNQSAGVNGLAIGPSDEIIVTGPLRSTTDFGGGPVVTVSGAVFIARFDANGSHLWSEAYGDPNSKGGANGYALVLDHQANIVTTGIFTKSALFDGVFGNALLMTNGGDDIFLGKFKP